LANDAKISVMKMNKVW